MLHHDLCDKVHDGGRGLFGFELGEHVTRVVAAAADLPGDKPENAGSHGGIAAFRRRLAPPRKARVISCGFI